jgi:ABC-type transport system substrate-binding protein
VKPLSNKLLNVGVAAIFAMTVVTAASSPVLARQANKPAAAMKTLRWYGLGGTATWANTLDPTYVTDSISYNVLNMVQGNLVKLLPSGAIVPGLAKSWTISNHHKTYTFHMRSGLRFSNGDKLTPADVVFSIKRALNPATKSPVAPTYLGAIKTIKAKGNNVVVTLNRPIVYFLETLSYPTGDVLDPRIIKGHPVNTYMTTTCAANVGAGAFKFQCRNKSSALTSFYPSHHTPTMTMVPNKYYYGPKPKIKVVSPAIPDTQTNFKDFQAGGVDVTTIPTVQISNVKHKKGFYDFPTSVTDYMTPNEHASSPFHNVHCRLAVAYSINRDAINKQILHGTQVSTYQVLPENLLGFSKTLMNNKNAVPHYNVKKAKAEFAKCPQLHGKTIQVPYQHTSVDIDNEYAAVVAMMGNVGIHAKLEPLTFNDWLGVVGGPASTNGLDNTSTKGHVDITENLWIEDYPDPQDYMTNLLRGGVQYDIGYFNNKTYNKLVDNAEVQPNVTKRKNMYIQAQKIALNAGAWIAMGNARGLALTNPKVHGLVGSAAYGILAPKGDEWANVTIH